jgi:hypothetical protein
MVEQVQPKKPEIVSAPKIIPEDPEARREWYRQMRERMGQSRFKVENIPAGYTIYWARKDDEIELSRLDSLGFKIVRDDPKNPRYKANGLREDGTYILGDVILMEIPTELWVFYEQDNLERARMLVEGVPKHFIEEAGKQKVPAFEVDEKHKKVR